MKNSFLFLALAALILCMQACGSSQYMPSISSYGNVDTTYQYSDETVLNAFEQQPQLKFPLKVAIYDAGFESINLAEAVMSVEGIESVTNIAPSLIEGEQYYNRLNNPWFAYEQTPAATDPKKLRTIAAQSHSDVIVYITTNHKAIIGNNALSAFYVALFPIAFVKGNTVEVQSYIDMYIVDVRNGFIYYSYRNRMNSKDRFAKLNYQPDIERIKGENVKVMKEELLEILSEVLTNSDNLITR